MTSTSKVIGIGGYVFYLGPSCGGKSTLSNWLSMLLNARIIHQDKFYKPDKDIPSENGIANWDCPEAIDNESFFLALKSCASSEFPALVGPNRPKINLDDISSTVMDSMIPKIKTILDSGVKITLVDGFLIYHSPELVSQYDLRFFMQASYETLEKRRASRMTYITNDGTWEDPPNYFRDCVWPAYLKYNESAIADIKHGSAYTLLNTETFSIEQNVSAAINAIYARIASNTN